MKKIVSVAVLLAGSAIAAPASAEETRFVWGGFYAGGHVGGATGSTAFDLHTDFPDYGGMQAWFFDQWDAGGALVGAHVGYNKQHESFVFGIEGDLTSGGFDTRFEAAAIPTAPLPPPMDAPLSTITVEHRPAWIATARARAGIAHGRMLFYGTGGLSLGLGAPAHEFMWLGLVDKQTATEAFQLGWNLGLGAEVMMNDRVSVRAEYLLHRFGSKAFTFNFPSPVQTSIGYDLHTLKLGASMHF